MSALQQRVAAGAPGTQRLRAQRRVGCRPGESAAVCSGATPSRARTSLDIPSDGCLARGVTHPRFSSLVRRGHSTSDAARCHWQYGSGSRRRWCCVFHYPCSAAAPKTPAQQPERIATLARARFGPLSAAELTVVRSAPRRELAWVGPDANPDNPANDPTHGKDWGPERSVRAGLLRWLHTDPEVSRQIDPSGLGIAGARITGTLDLSYVKADTPITLVRCYIPDGIDLTFSHLQSLRGTRERDGSDLRRHVRAGARSVGSLRHVRPPEPLSVAHRREPRLHRRHISQQRPETVNAVESTIAGDAVFHDGFTTDGIVDLRLARLGQSLSFHGAIFSGTAETGLNAERAVIGGTLYWVAIQHTPRTQLDLENTKADALWDDEASWPAPGMLTIDGFVYNEFAGGPADADARLRWLKLQPPGYRPQPYRQVATVLRDSGRETGATDVLIAKEEVLRRAGRPGAHGAGVEPHARCDDRIRLSTAARPLVDGGIRRGRHGAVWLGYLARIVTPTDASAYRAFVESGTAPPHYPPFNAFIYSLENFLPVVALHQEEYWRPNPLHKREGRREERWQWVRPRPPGGDAAALVSVVPHPRRMDADAAVLRRSVRSRPSRLSHRRACADPAGSRRPVCVH